MRLGWNRSNTDVRRKFDVKRRKNDQLFLAENEILCAQIQPLLRPLSIRLFTHHAGGAAS